MLTIQLDIPLVTYMGTDEEAKGVCDFIFLETGERLVSRYLGFDVGAGNGAYLIYEEYGGWSEEQLQEFIADQNLKLDPDFEAENS